MFNFLRVSGKYLFLASLLCSFTYAIEIESPKHAVDVAGKQRMYTQRMLKDYTMIGMKNSFGKPDEDLKLIMDEFENHLQSLHDYTKNKEIKHRTDEVKEMWVAIKKSLQNTPTKERVPQLQEDLEKLLDLSNDVTHLFAKETGEEAGEIVDMSGRQRMLSQRMASLYMLKVWGINDEKFKEKMEKTMTLFKESLKTLQASKLNTKEISELLEKVERSFMFFEVMNRSKSAFIPTLMYKKSNDILKDMNLATQKYVVAQSK